MTDTLTTGSGRYLTFTLHQQSYALDINDITEIIEYRTLTNVPMMPPHIRGVINLRGRVLPVIDLATRFGQPATTPHRRTSIIIINTPTTDTDTTDPNGIGILVDTVNKVTHYQSDDLEPPPAFGTGIRTDYITAMANHDQQFTIILNTTTLLATPADTT
jgi:purine-binding chemotaxis protein CheW